MLAEPAWDIHTAPYADRVEAATHVFTIEQLNNNWSRLGLPPLPESLNVRGAISAAPVVPFAEEITLAFERDYALWQEVSAAGGFLLK